jgi:hypothetical protein
LYYLLSQWIMVGRLLSPRPRPYGRVERSAFSVRSPVDKADFSTSAHSLWAYGRNDPYLSGFLSVDFTNNLDTHANQ